MSWLGFLSLVVGYMFLVKEWASWKRIFIGWIFLAIGFHITNEVRKEEFVKEQSERAVQIEMMDDNMKFILTGEKE